MQKACVRFCQQPSHAAADAMMMWRVFSRIFASFSPKLLDSQSHDNKRPGWRSLRVRLSLLSTVAQAPLQHVQINRPAPASMCLAKAFSASAHSPPFLPRLADELPHARARARVCGSVRCGAVRCGAVRCGAVRVYRFASGRRSISSISSYRRATWILCNRSTSGGS
jgi:hypothetical protein